jgi:hypothetical protein
LLGLMLITQCSSSPSAPPTPAPPAVLSVESLKDLAVLRAQAERCRSPIDDRVACAFAFAAFRHQGEALSALQNRDAVLLGALAVELFSANESFPERFVEAFALPKYFPRIAPSNRFKKGFLRADEAISFSREIAERQDLSPEEREVLVSASFWWPLLLTDIQRERLFEDHLEGSPSSPLLREQVRLRTEICAFATSFNERKELFLVMQLEPSIPERDLSAVIRLLFSSCGYFSSKFYGDPTSTVLPTINVFATRDEITLQDGERSVSAPLHIPEKPLKELRLGLRLLPEYDFYYSFWLPE